MEQIVSRGPKARLSRPRAAGLGERTSEINSRDDVMDNIDEHINTENKRSFDRNANSVQQLLHLR